MDESIVNKLESCSEKEFLKCIVDFNKENAESSYFLEFNLSLKKRVISLLFNRLNQWPEGRLALLGAIRILCRDKYNLDELFTRDDVCTLVNLAGLVAEEEEVAKHCTLVSDPKVLIDAQKCICNLIYNSSLAQKTCCNNGCIEGILLRLRIHKDLNIPREIKFLDMKMLFLITALCPEIRPKVCYQLHGLTYLMEVLDLILKDNISRYSATNAGRRTFNKGRIRGKANQGSEVCTAPWLCDGEVTTAVELLKVLFNLTINIEKSGLEEEEEAQYLRLVSLLHDILLCDTKNPDSREILLSHAIDLLANMPNSSYEELLIPVVEVDDDNPNIFDGMDMEAISTLLQFLEQRLEKLHKDEYEIFSPIFTTLKECAQSHSTIRKFFKERVLIPLKNVMNKLEEGTTLSKGLVLLMNSPDFEVKEHVVDFLFVLCKENPARLIKCIGHGNAAGFLDERGLMDGGRGEGVYSSDSEDSDTEEHPMCRDEINPVLGSLDREPPPDPLEEMTEEQLEYEAMQFIISTDRLIRNGVIHPIRVGEDGRPELLESIMELLQDFFIEE